MPETELEPRKAAGGMAISKSFSLLLWSSLRPAHVTRVPRSLPSLCP
jgi:hypothetical protein